MSCCYGKNPSHCHFTLGANHRMNENVNVIGNHFATRRYVSLLNNEKKRQTRNRITYSIATMLTHRSHHSRGTDTVHIEWYIFASFCIDDNVFFGIFSKMFMPLWTHIRLICLYHIPAPACVSQLMFVWPTIKHFNKRCHTLLLSTKQAPNIFVSLNNTDWMTERFENDKGHRPHRSIIAK